MRGFVGSALIVAFTLLSIQTVRGHETDQFTIPPGREFADVGPYMSRWMYDRIDDAVRRTNERIRSAVDRGATSELEDLHSGDHMAGVVNGEFPWAMDMIEGFEAKFHSDEMWERYPGRVVAYKHPTENILQHTHFILDPRQVFRLWLASTTKMYGTYVGPDKLGHFTDMGMNYYREYRKGIREGLDEQWATKKAVYYGTHGLVFSERGMLGYLTAGAYSNGDLAANLLGMLFYRNLTEPVMLKGKVRPAMLVREGEYWRMADHVRRDNDFFAMFISDHLDEALNPSLFEADMRSAVHSAVQERAENVLLHYADERGNIRPKEWFEKKREELTTYWGVDYGHEGTADEVVSIANTCLAEDVASRLPARQPVYLATGGQADPQGWTELHWAARGGTAQQVAQLAKNRTAIDAVDHEKQTPLHWAAAADNEPAARELLRDGATMSAGDGFQTTPLHIAAGQRPGNVAKLLIATGAAVSVRDDFGCTPLHDAARSGSEQVVALLLSGGANVNERDDYGNTPLHLACRNSREGVARLLVEKGANVNAANSAGSTPLHEAALCGDRGIVKLLLEHQAKASANKKGWKPADVARAHGYGGVAEMLR